MPSPVRFRLSRVNTQRKAKEYRSVQMGKFGILVCIDARAEIFLPALFQRVGRIEKHATIVLWRCLTISSKELQINEEIRDKEVRVIDADGSQLGVMSAAQALEKAAASNLDLVKIAPQATPPVCKIIDYGKYRFEQAKREKEARKNQRVVDVKEIRLSLNIDTHDFNTKVGHATRFLKDGDKVNLSIRFRGREMGHPEHG